MHVPLALVALLGQWGCGGTEAALSLDPATTPEVRVSPGPLTVRVAPRPTVPTRGLVEAGEPFEVLGRVTGTGCDEWGWLGQAAFACLDDTQTSADEPLDLPRLVVFDPPEPAEAATYRDTGAWPRDDRATALLPFIYATRRGPRWPTRYWDSPSAWERGEPPLGRLQSDHSFRFLRAVHTALGEVLVRPDGTAVPLDEAWIYPVSRFEGRDLRIDPPPEGWSAGWVGDPDGVKLRATPAQAAAIVGRADWQRAIDLRPTPDGLWWEVADGLGPGVSGYAPIRARIRRWTAARRPAEVADDELWLDVDRNEQVLAVLEGDEALFATLVSTGAGARYATPTGTWRVAQKATWSDMHSQPGSGDPYAVDAVPWTLAYRTRYAIHGTYWHGSFGQSMSHGCINLSVADARHVFDRARPALPAGWRSVFAVPEDPGTLVRVR